MSHSTTTRRRTRPGLTDQERAERRRRDRERIEQATKELLSSDGWKRWVRVRSRNGLARYSFGNQLLIAMQRPDATFVAGFRAFLELNRCVRKGEKAIRILAPMAVRDSGKETPEETEVDERGRRILFRTVFVFDVAQTEPLPDREPVSLEAPTQPIAGDSHTKMLKPLEELAKEFGYVVSYRTVSGFTDGWCDFKEKTIVVNDALSGNGQVRVLVHELAHASGIGYAEHGRAVAEVLVDTITYIVCSSIGLDVSGSSVPYVAGWGEDGELEAIKGCAELIDRTASQIEGALV